MKIRSGFVSNSSSASFVVTFKSDLSFDEIGFIIRKSDSWIDDRWEGGTGESYDISTLGNSGGMQTITVDYPAWKDSLSKKGNLYDLRLDTTMFNDWYDVGAANFVRALQDENVPGVELVQILQTEDQMDNTDEIVKFDPHCWEYENHVISPWGKEKKKDIQEAKDKQHNIDMDYLEYLSSIGTKLSEKQTRTLAKYQLGK